MASLITEIVRYAGESEISDLKGNIQDLSQTIFDLKCEMEKEIESTYVNLLGLPNHKQNLVEEVKRLSSRMNILQEKVDSMVKHELESSTSELQKLSSRLMETSLQLSHVTLLEQMDHALQEANKSRESEEYPQAAKCSHKLLCLLDNVPSESSSLDIYKALHNEVCQMQERLLYELKDIWKENLRWEEPEPDLDTLSFKENVGKKKTPHRAALHVDTSCLNKLEKVFVALSVMGSFDYHVSKFASNFMRLILQPISTQEGEVNILQDTNERNEALLEVETYPNKTHPSYMHVLQNLRKVFNFTRKYLMLQVEESKDEGKMVTLVERIGLLIGGHLSEMLVTGCLAHSVHSHGHDFYTFQQAAAEALAFHQELKSIGFLPEGNESLVTYASNIDVLFAKKICELHLHSAREIARKDLHDTMSVDILISQEELPCKDDDNDPIKPFEQLSDYTFQFAKCQISKSAHELVELLIVLLEEAEKGSDVSCGCLLRTARQIVELYWAVSKTHHQQMISTIPQQAALFHNNCMYVAHRLITLGAEHQTLGIHFFDQLQGLRELGASVLLKYMQESRLQIINILRDSGLSSIGEDSSLPPTTEKALRQCLRQLELLKVVWSPILPQDAYCKTVGCLLNALVEEIVVRIVSLEDIPSHVATLLANLFSDVLERAPEVFPDKREVQCYVQQWHRLEALVKVLQASLTDIADNWADGAGPFARAFLAKELKQLIRALFQNNKRRAAILALIK